MSDVIIEKKVGSSEADAFASIINQLIGSGGDILKELIRTAQTNPIVGIFLVYLLVDLFQDSGRLHADSATTLKVILAAGAGIQLTDSLLNAIGSLIPLAGIDNTYKPTLFTPTVTTLVNSDRVDPASAAELGKKP